MTQLTAQDPQPDFLSKPLLTTINIDWEKAIYFSFIIIAIITRFWDLGSRVMSHDESLHTQFSYQFYNGDGYNHTPLMHGPFLFHITAVSYWLFGASDFSARIPVAIFGVLLVVMPYFLRHWIGRMGALFASFIFLISPYITYYSRYIRHDIYVIMWALILFISIWGYIKDKDEKYLWWFAAGNALMFATKEVSFIYVAIFGSFLIIRLLIKLVQTEWLRPKFANLRPAIFVLLIAILMIGAGLAPRLLQGDTAENVATTEATEGFAADPNETLTTTAEVDVDNPLFAWLQIIGIGVLSLGLVLVAKELRPQIDQMPEFDLIVLFTTLILPTVSPIFAFIRGWNPRDYSFNSCGLDGQADMSGLQIALARLTDAECWNALSGSGILRTGGFLAITLIISIAVGLWWNNRRWIIAATIFHAIAAVLYTSVFTNPDGWASGMIGSLGYWLEQHEVQRGSQPTYYYLFVVSLYEFLPLIFTGLAIRHWLRKQNLDKILGYWLWTFLFATIFYSLINWLYNRPPLQPDQAISNIPAFIFTAVFITLRILYWFLVKQRQLRQQYGSERRLWSYVDVNQWIGFVPFVIWWFLLTWVAYSIAGEKMPWLSTHFVIPMAFLCGWYFNDKLKDIRPQALLSRQTGLLIGLTIVLIVAVALALVPLLLGQIQFGNQELGNLSGIGRFLGAVVIVAGLAYLWQQVNQQTDETVRVSTQRLLLIGLIIALSTLIFLLVEPILMRQISLRSGAGIIRLILIIGAIGSYLFYRNQAGELKSTSPVLILSLFAVLSFLTIRFMYLANFPNADYTTEYMVYAHGAPATKDTVMQQVEELSMRMYGDKSIRVSFDSDVSWPFTWYLRDYPNRNFFGENPSNNLNESPIIIVGRKNWDKTEPFLGDNYERREYTFLWWPMEEYRHISWNAILGDPNSPQPRGLGNAEVRQALWDIFFYRDYEQYGNIFGSNYTAGEWPLRHDLRLYVRKDVIANLWDYGVGAVNAVGLEDPYAEGELTLEPVLVINESGIPGVNEGQLSAPRNVAVGSNGNIYVADSGNHRIQVFDANGNFITAWGSIGAEAGQINEPWGLAVDDEFVYVADTWNHRVQAFTLDGDVAAVYGASGSPVGEEEGLGLFFGPRDILLLANDGLLVTDTGNHRLQIMDRLGNFLFQLGSLGSLPGQLNEPVGLGRGPDNSIYVADTWNGRVQRYNADLVPQNEWRVDAWTGQSINNKPYLAIDSSNRVYITDPEAYRVLIFNADGTYLGRFGSFGTESNHFGLPNGITIDSEDNIYIADAANNRILKYAPIFPPTAPLLDDNTSGVDENERPLNDERSEVSDEEGANETDGEIRDSQSEDQFDNESELGNNDETGLSDEGNSDESTTDVFPDGEEPATED